LRGGGTFSNKSFAGKVTIVEFFGLWCPDCMADAPNVAELAGLVRATPGVQFVAVHTRGRYGRWGSLDNFFKEKGYSYPVAIDDDSAVYKAFGIQWVPSYLIIDAKGVVRDFTTDLGVSGLGAKGLLARALKVKQLKSK
jgi:thiol-disulfide isomerase/thioredoxin